MYHISNVNNPYHKPKSVSIDTLELSESIRMTQSEPHHIARPSDKKHVEIFACSASSNHVGTADQQSGE